MTHAVRIKNGKASYGNRFIETERLKQEKKAGFPLFDKVRGRAHFMVRRQEGRSAMTRCGSLGRS